MWELAKIIPGRHGTRIPRAQLTPHLIYPCKDGYISWRIYTAALGRGTKAIVDIMEEWGEMEPEVEGIDFTTIDMNYVDQETYETWERGFGKFFAKHTKAEILQEALKHNFMTFPVTSIDELLSCEQLKAREYWVNVEHPELDVVIPYPGAPFKLTRCPWRISRRAPLIGEHNEEVYVGELGMSKKQFCLLREQGVI